MKRCLIFLLFVSPVCLGQWQAEIMAGFSKYSGDLNRALIDFRTVRPAANLTIKYQMDHYFYLRASVGYGQVLGNDKFNKEENLKARNLSFQSNIYEANVALEMNLLDPDYFDIYPFAFAGIGLFQFKPHAKDNAGNKVFLKPLSTEGQGLVAYPDREPYSLTQLCLPFGLGIKMRLTPKLFVGYEAGWRKTFTDYIDDVSKGYVDYETLLIERGEKAVEMAFRPDAVINNGFLPPGGIRGNPKKKDWYFFTGLKVTMNIGNDSPFMK